MCEPNFFGKHCEKSTYGFQPYSYMAFPSLKPSTNDISIVFSTNRRDALLAYNFGAQNGGRSDFVALEIVHGKPQFSFGGSRTAVAKVSLERDVADGDWHRVTVIRNGRVCPFRALKTWRTRPAAIASVLGGLALCGDLPRPWRAMRRVLPCKLKLLPLSYGTSRVSTEQEEGFFDLYKKCKIILMQRYP